ncbi:MAG: SdrD B-like domain-containing protein [Bacteroidota bacterium]
MAYNYRELTFPLVVALLLMHVAPTQGQINISLQLSNPACGGFANGSITAIPLSGQSPYTYLWSNGSTDNPLNNIPAGNYTVTVTDFNGLTGTASGTLTEPPPLFVQIVVTDCGILGDMEADVTGGIMPFSYEWSTGDTTPSINNLATGLYCLTVTDINSCAFQTCESIGTPMALTMETDTAFCGAELGGAANVSVTGGVWPFDFEWSNGVTNDSIFDLAPGTYTVTVTGENGCTEVISEDVPLGPGEYDIDFDNINPGCSGSNTGSVTALGDGGVAPYIFIWSTNDTAATVSDLPAGTYYVTATDDYGCVEEDSTELVTASSITLDLGSENPLCAGGTDGEIRVVADNGAAPYTYLWSTGDSTQMVSGLPADTYVILVSDTLNCIAIDSISLFDPPPLEFSISSTNVTVCGESDGTATVMVSSIGTPPYRYAWSNGDTTSMVDSLPVGTYGVTLTDANDCPVKDSIMVTGPSSLNVSVTGSSIVCSGENNGSLTAEVEYGTPPYLFEWSNGETGSTIDNLPAGNYTVTVTSSEGCIGIDSATIANSPPINVSANINDVSCFGFTNGSISVSLSGGTAPISISWENGSNSTIRNGLNAGEYMLLVTDDAGCTRNDTFNVEQPDEIEISFNSSAGSCGDNGFSIAIAIGGTMPYTYEWSTGSTTAFVDGLAPGNYTVTVTDDNDCSSVATANIAPYPAIDLTVVSTNTNCNGSSDGTATANTTGGNAPYNFLWNNGQTTPTISNLSPGVYSVTVTDANDCTSEGNTEVFLGNGLSVTISGSDIICPGESGTLTAMTTGGAPFYDYQWSNGESSQMITDLNAGTYQVTITDPDGCSGEAEQVIVAGGNYTVDSSFENVDCAGESTGRIQLEVMNATPPILYFWSNGGFSSEIENIPAGNYTVTVADASNCTQTLDFNISEPPLLELEVIGTDGTCGNLGSASSIVDGGTMPYFYEWSNGSTNSSINILGPGTYQLTITDAKGCQAVDSAIIEVIPSISCNIMLVQPISSINGNDGILTAMTNGGLPPFNYEWSNGQTTETISNLSPGNYAVTITDEDNCATTCNFFLMDGARIGDFVWEDSNGNGIQDAGENGLQDVMIRIEGTDGYGNMIDATTTTDVLGNYSFDVVPGSYELTFNTPNGYLPSPNLQGTDPALDSDADPFTNKTGTLSINGGIDNQSIDAGFVEEINCDNITDAGEICCEQTLCAPGEQPEQLNNLLPPSGGTGTLEYLWTFSEQPGPFDPLTWTSIPNSNNPDFTPPSLQDTTYFVRRARREGCADFFQSNPVSIIVKDFQPVEIIGSDTICAGEPADFIATNLGPDASYSWSFPSASPNSAVSNLADNIIWEETGIKDIFLEIEIDGCQLTANGEIFITDNVDLCGYDLVLNGILTNSMEVELDWVYPESNTVTRTYLVEWVSENGTFEPLGPPDSTEQAGNLVHYFYTHKNPRIGINEYRVVLNDSQGNQLISNTVEIFREVVTVDTNNIVFVESFPNPFKEKITVEVIDRFDGIPINIELINSLGQLVFFDEIKMDMDRYEINTSNFSQGTYFLFVRYGNKPQKIFKLIKLE